MHKQIQYGTGTDTEKYTDNQQQNADYRHGQKQNEWFNTIVDTKNIKTNTVQTRTQKNAVQTRTQKNAQM